MTNFSFHLHPVIESMAPDGGVVARRARRYELTYEGTPVPLPSEATHGLTFTPNTARLFLTPASAQASLGG